MNLENVITAKNANYILTALIMDINNILEASFQEVFNQAKKQIPNKKLYESIHNAYQQKITQGNKLFLQNEASILFECTYNEKQEKGVNDIISNFHATKKTMELIENSNLNEQFKTQYYQSILNNYYCYDDVLKSMGKIYQKYDIHLNNKNYDSWSLKRNKKLLNDFLKTPKYLIDVSKLNLTHQFEMLNELCQSDNVSIKEFEKVIPYFKNLFQDKKNLKLLMPYSLGVNQKTFLFYEKNNIQLKEIMSQHTIEEYTYKYNDKSKLIIVQKLKEQGNDYIFHETDVVNNMTVDKLSMLSHNWNSLKDVIQYKNEKLSPNQSFLSLTKKMINRYKNKSIQTKLNDAIITIEKEVLEENLVPVDTQIKPTKKMKI